MNHTHSGTLRSTNSGKIEEQSKQSRPPKSFSKSGLFPTIVMVICDNMIAKVIIKR